MDEFNNYTDEFNNYTDEDFQTKAGAISKTLTTLNKQLKENKHGLRAVGQEYYQAWAELQRIKTEKVKSAYAPLVNAKNELLKQAKKDKEVLKLQERYNRARSSPQTQHVSIESLNQLQRELEQKEQEVFNQLQTKYAAKLQALEKDATKAQQEFEKEMDEAVKAKGSIFDTLRANAKKLGEERRAIQQNTAKEKQNLTKLQTARREAALQRTLDSKEKQNLDDIRHKLTERRRSLQQIYEELERKVSQDTDVEKWAKAYDKAMADGTPKDLLGGIKHTLEQSKKTAKIKALQTQQTTINKIESDILQLEAQQNAVVIEAETRERARLQKQLRQNTQKQSASTATKTVKKKPEWVRTLYTPSEIIAGKVPKGKTVHVPMKLVTANGQHYNEYTGISEEELVKKYHFPPDQAKKMAKQYSVEEYQKLDKVMVKPLKESATVSKMAKVPVGGKTTYNGPQDAGSKGTAYHTVAEMVFGDENWTVEEILSEFAKKKNKNATSRLTEKQYNDLSGLTDIYNVLGFKTQGKKAQTAAATHLNSFVDMLRPAIQAYGKPIMERTLGGVTTLEDGKLAAWGGTFDMLLGNLLLDLKSNQKMGNSMGWQLNMLKFLLDIAREAGMTVPEITSLEIAHQPAVTGKNKHLSPSPSINKIRSIGHDNMSNYILDILHQTLDPHPKTYYNAKPFEKEGQLIPHLTTGKFLTEEGKEVTTWKDVNYGYLKEMLNVRRSEESLAQLAAYMKENYTPAELSQVYRTLYGTTQYSEVIAKEGERKGQPLPVKTPVDIFTAGNTWDPKDTSLQDALWTLQKLMLPTAIQSGQSGVITESSFMGDNGEYVDTVKLNDFNVKDLAVMYKTAVQKKEINLANSITKYVANTLKDYFKDVNDTESIRLGQQVANQINNLYTKAHTTEGEIAYENFAIAIGENLGIDYHKRLDPTTGRYVTARTPEFDLSNNAARKFAPNVETAVDYDFFSTRTDDTAEREIQRLAQSGSDNFYNIRAFDRQYDEFNDQEFARDVYERNTISPDHLANWIYGVMHQEAKINTLFEPYYNSFLKKNNLTSEQVSFDDFVKRILADDPALYQQYRDSQKLQEEYKKAAGVSFGTFGTTAEQAARGFEGIKQFLGSQLPQNLTLESDALYNSWNLATDKQALDKRLLFYAQGGRPESPFGKDFKNNPTLLSRLARREGTRFYGRSDKMGDEDNIPSAYREELQNLKTSIADINQATDAVIDNVLAEEIRPRDEVLNEVFEKYIGSNKKLSQKEKDASLNAVMNPETQRYYKQLRDALKQYRSLVGNERAQIVFDPEDRTVYGGAFVNGKFQEISEQDLPNEYSEQIGEALDRWHEAYAELLVRIKKHDLPVLREMHKYDQKAESYAKIDKEIDKQVVKTQKIQITDQMVQDFYDSAQEKLLKPFKKNPQTSNNKPFKLSKNSGRWSLSDDLGPSISDLRDIQLDEDVDRWLKIHTKDKRKADPAALTKAVHDPKLYQMIKDMYGTEEEFARLLGWDYQAGKTPMGAHIDPTSKDIIYSKQVQDRVDQLRAQFIPSAQYSTWEDYEQALKHQVAERDRLADEQANYLVPDVAKGYDAAATNRAAFTLLGARVRQELNPSLPTQEPTPSLQTQELTPALEERTKTEAKSIEVDKESTQALQGESDAVKDKVGALKELITALKEKTDAEQQGIAADQKSEQAVEKSTDAAHKRRKKITASDSLKQQLENQKVREEIAESKAREAAALAKTGNGKGKTQGAGEKEDFNQYKKNLNEITKAMNERDKIEKELATTPQMLSKGRTAREQLLVEYEGIISKLTTENELLIEQGRLSKDQVAQIEAEAQARRKLNSLKVQGAKYGAGNFLDVLGANIKNTITRMFDYTGVYRILNKLMASISKIIQLTKELDTAMFNLRVVTGGSREDATGLIRDYRALADQLGATTVQIANAANEWLRQGYEAQQAGELITASTYLSKLGMIDAGQATEYLTSMIKGFKLEVSDAVDVVSKLTAVDMKAAVSAADIGAALQNVATTAQLAGVSLDETIAYASTIIETTQRDASSVGMALRTIMSRYGNVKAGAYTKMNLEASSDTDLENLNDIEKVLGKIGISIRSTNTEFRSFSDVLEELSDRWINLDNVSKNAIATAMAGVRQREQFLVLMENMDRAEELEEVSAHSQGTAESKYAAYMETIQSASNRLQSAWENLAMTLEQSGLVKLFTDLSVVLMKILLPSIRAVGTALIQYNAFKVPLWMKEFFSVGKGRSFVNGLGPTKFAQYQQDWKASKLEDIQKKQTEEANNKLAQSATSTASALDQVTESASQGAAAEAQGTKEENKNTNATSRDTEETQKHAKAVAQDTNQQKTGGVPGETTGEDGKVKKFLKQSVKPNIPGAALGGLFSGITTGIATEGSIEAQVAAGAVSGGLTAILGAFGGPLGAMIGSTIGSVIATPLAHIIDAEEIARKKRIETASKLLETLKSQEASLENLYSVSKQSNLLSDDIKSIRENVQAIKDADKDTGAFKDAFEAIIGQEKYSDLITATSSASATDLYLNLDSILADENISSKIRSRLAKVAKMARIDAEDAAFMASKEGLSLTADEEKERLNRELKKAYLESGISDESSLSLARRGVADVERQIAGLANVELTTEVKRLIQLLMKQDDSTSVQSLLAGSRFTLSDIINNTYGLSTEVQTDLLNQAALALGMTLDEVRIRVDDFGLLTIGDLNSSISDLSESLESLTSYFDELMSTGTLSVESLRAIIAKNGAEATTIGQDNLSLVTGAMEQEYRVLGGQLLKDWTGGTASGAKIYEKLLNDPSMKKVLETLDQGGFNKDSTSLDSLLKALMTPGFGELEEETQNDIWELYLDTYKKAAKNIGNVTTAEYNKVVQSAQQAIDRSLERQQNALEEQKSALEQINKQREYENKLIEAKIKLENAQNEKKKVWREGIGWVYEADTSAIADAQKVLEELDNEKKVNELQVMIDELQAQRDWMSNLTESKEFDKAQKFMKEWAGNAKSTMDVLKYWENVVENPPTFDVLEDNKELQKQQVESEYYKNAQTVESLKQAYTDLTKTKGMQLLLGGGSLADLGKMDSKDIDAFNSARGAFEKAYDNASKYLNNETVRELTGLSGDEGDKIIKGYEETVDKVQKNRGGVGNITSGIGANTADLSTKGNESWSPWIKKQIGEEWQVTGNKKALPGGGENNTYLDDKTWWWNQKAQIFFWSDDKQKWISVRNAKENPKSYSEMLHTSGFQGRFFTQNGEIYYLGKDGVMYAVEKVSSHASGTLSTAGGLSMVNDDPQYGLEGIITPQGTLTALPSKSGVVPADLTRNVWQLGEVAPNLIKQLVDINGKFSHTTGFGTDESFNVEHLDVHMVAQPGFDMDDFVRQLQAARNLTRHS